MGRLTMIATLTMAGSAPSGTLAARAPAMPWVTSHSDVFGLLPWRPGHHNEGRLTRKSTAANPRHQARLRVPGTGSPGRGPACDRPRRERIFRILSHG